MGPRPAKSQVSIIAPGGEKKTQMNPFSNVSSTVLWILLASLATVCLVVLTVVSYLFPLAARSVRVFPRTLLASQERPRASPRTQEKDAALVSKPPHPLEESMKRLGTTMAVGLRSPKLKHENPQKVAEEAVRLPDHIKDCGKTFNEQKRKYHSLFRKSRKSATEWQPFGSGLYYVSRGKKSWYDAENFCLSREAHLTSILSSEEQNHVTSQLTQPAWIGLTDGGRGKWEWTDGSRLIAQFWSQGHPGHSERPGDGEQGCTIIVPLSKGLNWNEVDCNQLNRWVCKGTLGAEEPQIHQTH